MDTLEPFLVGPIGRRLAFDLIAQLKPVAQLLEDYGLSETALAELLQHPIFEARVREEKAVWLSSENTAERVKLRAQLQVEHGQLVLTEILAGETVSPSVKIDAMKQLAALAGLDRRAAAEMAAAVPAGPQFQIKFVFQEAGKELVLEGTQLPTAVGKPEPVEEEEPA
jgi:hypothetical protein